MRYVFMDTAECTGVNAFYPGEHIDYIFPETGLARRTMEIFPCKNREMVSLTSDGHFCHLTYRTDFCIYIFVAYFHNSTG